MADNGGDNDSDDDDDNDADNDDDNDADNDDDNDADNDDDNDADNDDDNDADNDVLYSYCFQWKERGIQCFYINADNIMYSCINSSIICVLKCTLHNDWLVCIEQMRPRLCIASICLTDKFFYFGQRGTHVAGYYKHKSRMIASFEVFFTLVPGK